MKENNKWENMILAKGKEIGCEVLIDKRIKNITEEDVKEIINNLEEEVYSFLSRNKKYVVDIETWFDDIVEKNVVIYTKEEWKEMTGEEY